MLEDARIPYVREFVLGPRSRIDFYCPSAGVGIEVKKGKPNRAAVTRQVTRYCGYARIEGLILVVERSLVGHPSSCAGKPVCYVPLNKQWGLAL